MTPMSDPRLDATFAADRDALDCTRIRKALG
jgi:hypothetical protein